MTAYNRNAANLLPAELPHIEWITDPIKVGRLSMDFSWFSPPLKEKFGSYRADIVARPQTEDDIRSIVAACHQHRIPLTVRGSGTGNYAQAVPLHGGVVLDMSAFNAFGWASAGVGRAQTGIRLGDFERQAREHGHELRWMPSTFRTASLGGFFGGGFGGAGSITYGPIRSAGNILGARVMTMEAQPQIIELRGADAMQVHNTYGTTGIVLELEVALAPAQNWMEAIAVFEDFEAALRFADEVAMNPALLKRELCVLADPIPRYFTALADALPQGTHAVLLVLSESSDCGLQQVLQRHGGRITYQKTAAEVQACGRTLIEFSWNHTTLNALKHDKSFTYIQSTFAAAPHDYIGQILEFQKKFEGEVYPHVEFIRGGDGKLYACNIALVRYTTQERLNAIMQMHTDCGVHIDNAHVHMIEDGKVSMKEQGLLPLKQRMDPLGLLNPGKLRSWEELQAAQAPSTAEAA